MELNLPSRKYNQWCKKRILVCDDPKKIELAMRSLSTDVPPFARAALYFHELTDSAGFEFVAFSNITLKKYVSLPNNVILVPCFITDDNKTRSSLDPVVRATAKMKIDCRFLYDGWIPITKWDQENVMMAIRSIDEALSLFSLISDSYFHWEPKYYPPQNTPYSDQYEEIHLQELENLYRLIDELNKYDRAAIYRSIAWLSQGLRLTESYARFLSFILAIESLATYIENETKSDSSLAFLRSDKRNRQERLADRENCIRETLEKHLNVNPTEAIKMTYFDCVVGIKQRLRRHLENLFSPDTKPIELLFTQKVEGKSLFDLRNVIAHGDVDVLSETERNYIGNQLKEAEDLARKYIWIVLRKALSANSFNHQIEAIASIKAIDFLVPKEDMWQGPVHMSELYCFGGGSVLM